MKLAELSWPEMQRLDRKNTVAVVPVGSMEQHGPHLPFQVDAFISSRLAEDLEKRLPDILLVPPVWTGVSAHHMDFPGSITVRAKVLIGLLHDICASLHHHGFRRIVVLNGHGGNRASLEVLGQELFAELGLSVNTLAYWDLVPDLVKSLKKIKSSGMGHSGELETSLMLYLAPQMVRRQDIPEGVLGIDEPGPTTGIKRYASMKEHSGPGVIGMPSAASPEIGEQLYQGALAALERAVRALQAGH
ncbi:MAG TPA: creatininase family protein [Candidatus Binatia bacterium]